MKKLLSMQIFLQSDKNVSCLREVEDESVNKCVKKLTIHQKIMRILKTCYLVWDAELYTIHSQNYNEISLLRKVASKFWKRV